MEPTGSDQFSRRDVGGGNEFVYVCRVEIAEHAHGHAGIDIVAESPASLRRRHSNKSAPGVAGVGAIGIVRQIAMRSRHHIFIPITDGYRRS